MSRVGSQLPTGQPAKADSRPSEEALLVRAQKTQRPVFTLDIIDLYLIRPSFSCLTVLRQDQPNINVETETYTHIERERKKRQREPPHTHAHAHTRTHTLRQRKHTQTQTQTQTEREIAPKNFNNDSLFYVSKISANRSFFVISPHLPENEAIFCIFTADENDSAVGWCFQVQHLNIKLTCHFISCQNHESNLDLAATPLTSTRRRRFFGAVEIQSEIVLAF